MKLISGWITKTRTTTCCKRQGKKTWPVLLLVFVYFYWPILEKAKEHTIPYVQVNLKFQQTRTAKGPPLNEENSYEKLGRLLAPLSQTQYNHNTGSTVAESSTAFTSTMLRDPMNSKHRIKMSKVHPEALYSLNNLPEKISLTIESIVEPRSYSPEGSSNVFKSCWPEKIDKLLHFVWLDPKGNSNQPLPAMFEANLQRWAKYAPEHKLYIWQDSHVNRLISHIRIDALYRKLPLMVCKADLIRHIIAFYFGGTPLDLDLIPVVPLNYWFGPHRYGIPCHQSQQLELVAAPEPCWEHTFQMSGYSVMKGSPLLYRTLQNMFILLGYYVLGKDLPPKRVRYNVIRTTGPRGFEAGVRSYFNLTSIHPIESILALDTMSVYMRKYGFLPSGDLMYGRIAHQSVNLWDPVHPRNVASKVLKSTLGNVTFNLNELKYMRHTTRSLRCKFTEHEVKVMHSYEENYLYKNWDLILNSPST
eukprot:Nk52_evm14s684 gene=Nk52_evmTU14s684